MSTAFEVVLWLLAVLLTVPISVFVLECLLALLPGRHRREDGARPDVCVLIPAHNEEAGLSATLATLLPTLEPDDRVLVIADNCTDATASVARAQGVEVLERTDSEKRGKGFALEYGIRCLAARPAAVIVFLDADCQVTPQTVDQLARRVARTQRPVQGLNLSESESRGVQAVSSLGFHFKNHVRPAGLARLGMPCHLMGTGMALPWQLASEAVFGGAHLVEDMQLGVDLAIAGKATTFCPNALVTSRLPTGKRAFLSQRTRWEHGHLRTSLTQIPRLLRGFLRTGNVRLLALALDLTIPPFTMLLFVWGAALGVCGLGAALGCGEGPLLVLASAGTAIAIAALGGWAKYCRHVVSLGAMASIPIYMLRKLPIYAAFVLQRGPRCWVRTEREAAR
ncbi:MAG: glycosyltransferase [Planctomycetaceae bacterium]|nr:glycosyltransferase [Planctomycetaceae bacterium]